MLPESKVNQHSGAVIIEMTLVLGILVMLTAAAVDYGTQFAEYSSMNQIARAGALVAAMAPGDPDSYQLCELARRVTLDEIFFRGLQDLYHIRVVGSSPDGIPTVQVIVVRNDTPRYLVSLGNLVAAGSASSAQTISRVIPESITNFGGPCPQSSP